MILSWLKFCSCVLACFLLQIYIVIVPIVSAAGDATSQSLLMMENRQSATEIRLQLTHIMGKLDRVIERVSIETLKSGKLFHCKFDCLPSII